MSEEKALTPSPNVDILELIRSGTHFAEKRGDKVHVINAKTGETYIMYSHLTPGVPRSLTLVVLEDGTKVWTQEALAPSTRGVRETTFNPVIIDLMCQRILEGEGITDICGTDSMPSYATFTRWRREHPWIDEHLNRARTDRAEKFRDKAIKEADNARSTKDPLGATALRVDTYKWAAGIDQPERYSPKAKVEATISMPTQIIVHTGIDRTPPSPVDPGVVEEND